MTTPNCDELGHYLFRPTGAKINSPETLQAAMAQEVAAWSRILSVPVLQEGDEVCVEHTFMSHSEPSCKLHKGLLGKVVQIDQDGDAQVAFGGK